MSKRFTVIAFDDNVITPYPLTSNTVHSSVSLAYVLGLYDQMAFEVIVEQAVTGGNPEITVGVQHSADGINWLSKPDSPYIDEVISPDGQNVYVGFDDGSYPTLRFVRFGITLAGPTPLNARVRIEATLNDVCEGAYARKMEKTLEQQAHYEGLCTDVLQGGTEVYANDPTIAPLLAPNSSGQVPAIDQEYITFSGSGSHKKYYVADDARLCVRADGTVEMSKHGHTVAMKPSKDSSGSNGGGCG